MWHPPGAPLQGNPLSCKGMRKRLPAVAERVGCDCRVTDPVTCAHRHGARGVEKLAPRIADWLEAEGVVSSAEPL